MDFESDDRLVTVAGFLVRCHGVDQIGPCPSLLNACKQPRSLPFFTRTNPGGMPRFHEAGVVKLLMMQDATTAIPCVARSETTTGERTSQRW